MKYGITWSNDVESVCQTGYFTEDINEARRVALIGLQLGKDLSTWGAVQGHQVDGMNNADAPQYIKYAIIQTGEEDGMQDLECISLGENKEAVTVW